MSQKKNRFFTLICLFILCIMVCLPAKAEPGTPKKATVMIYMCGGGLESDTAYGTKDMLKIQNSGYNKEQINVVVLQGGSTAWYRLEEFDVTKLHIVEAGNRRATDVALWDYSSMGDPETLTRFLDFVRENYPAEKYYLIIWGHGSGPNYGLCGDDLYYGNRLSVNELNSALQNSSFGNKGIEVICFAGCMAGAIEFANAVAPYAHYMVAQQDNSNGIGYNWIKLLDSETDTLKILDEMVKEIYVFTEEHRIDNKIISVAAIDLDKIPNVVKALNSFFSKMIPALNQANFSKICQQLMNTVIYNHIDGRSDPDLLDLGDMIMHLREYAPEEADALLMALSDAVVIQKHELDSCTGLSIYHPAYNSSNMIPYIITHSMIPLSDDYQIYITEFYKLLNSSK